MVINGLELHEVTAGYWVGSRPGLSIEIERSHGFWFGRVRLGFLSGSEVNEGTTSAHLDGLAHRIEGLLKAAREAIQ